jgi:alginate O-acetyltransferase complex protein AlgI
VLFNSFEFLLFLPIVFILYWFVFNKKLSWQNGLVLVASYFFYGWWSWKFMGLLMLSTLLDYLYGFWVASPNRKKAKFFLYLSILNNLGILGVFKYYNFFALQFQKGFELLGLHTHQVLLNVALPIGISFYTFHGMSYVFDIYRGNQKSVKSFIDYAVFVSFFPLDSKYNTDYAKSKYYSELEAWRGKEEGLNVGVVLPGIILGVGSGNTPQNQFIGIVNGAIFLFLLGEMASFG